MDIKMELEDTDESKMEGFVETIKIEPRDLEDAIANIKTEASEDVIYNESIKHDCTSPLPPPEVGCDSFINCDVKELIAKKKRTKSHLRKKGKFVVKANKSKSKSNLENVSPSEKSLYKCDECDFLANNNKDFTQHMRTHTVERPYHCYFCMYVTKRRSHLVLHLKVHKSKLERTFTCFICCKYFATKRNLKEHSLKHTNEKPFACPHCGFRSNYKGNIRQHIKNLHPSTDKAYINETLDKLPELIVDNQSCICYICGKRLERATSLKRHVSTHSGEKPHLCELCGKYFSVKASLESHMGTHIKEKPFKCKECDYVTHRKAILQKHMKSHIKYHKLVKCSDCGKRYSTKLLLKHHVHEEHAIK